jgi:acyl dehydratase
MAIITRDTEIGQTFSGRKKTISWERLWTFSGGPFAAEGWPRKNLHTDLGFAKACGLPSVGASGTQYQGHLCELFLDLFGEAWLRTGSMTAKFIALVDVGDVLQSKAVVTSKALADGHVRLTFDIWCENQRGAKVLVGTATGLLP